MTQGELTACACLAKVPAMKGYHMDRWRSGRRAIAAAVLLGSLVALSGCVSVNAPDKPIVIELNINIRQEVIYRLAQDAQKTVEEHGDVF